MDVITIKDFIFIILGIAGLTGVSLYSIYVLMTKTVEARVKLFTEELHNNTMATINALVIGYDYWRDYVRGNNISDLNEAIDRTLEAYEVYAKKLDDKKPYNEELIC